MERFVYNLETSEGKKEVFLNPNCLRESILLIDETIYDGRLHDYQPHYEFKSDGSPRLFCKHAQTWVGPGCIENGIRWVPLSQDYPGWGELYASEEFQPGNPKHQEGYLNGIKLAKKLLDHAKKTNPDRSIDIKALEIICLKNSEAISLLSD